MKITARLFEAFLKCPMKCWLRSQGETPCGNEYAEWVESQNNSYRNEGAKRLLADMASNECVADSAQTENLKAAKWQLAVHLVAQAQDLESNIHAVERIPSKGRGKAATFIPIRFLFTNKLTREDRLLLTFDALVLSEVLKRGVEFGKIIHGENYSTLKVKTAALMSEVRKRTEEVATMLTSTSPPDHVLNRHCGECEFQTRCRERAIEKDDLSLLSGVSKKERKKFHSKGIFTVTQLSYTFRPRRRPKRLRDRKEKYHHALKALAIREKKIHIVGTPELKIDGTPAYLDVEGVPDRDFYYLIGVRIGDGKAAVQHSLWADKVEGESTIWRKFLAILETVEKPALIHYGSYEREFLKCMLDRYGGHPAEFPNASKSVETSINILSFIFAQVYFPTRSNGLKDIGGVLGFSWSERVSSGTTAIALRNQFEAIGRVSDKEALLTYNAEDCAALQQLVEFLLQINTSENRCCGRVVHADDLPREENRKFGLNRFKLPELCEINRAAYWDYQRERVLLKTTKPAKSQAKRVARKHPKPRPNKIIKWHAPLACPSCGEAKLYKNARAKKIIMDVRLSGAGIKRWTTRYDFYRYRCTRCHAVMYNQKGAWSKDKFGETLRAFVVYLIVELRLPQQTAATLLREIVGLDVGRSTINRLKSFAAQYYQTTYHDLLTRIATGRLIHADETKVDFKSRIAYIWAFTNLNEVAFVFADSREGDLLKSFLKDFKGILVSDFYAAYDSIECPQQKCLVHLIRDFNDNLMDEPFNEELKRIVAEFTHVLRPIVATVDRFGLKTRFLRRHKLDVHRFYRTLHEWDLQSETARKWRTRLEKNQNKLFTFLDYDSVPWNNNNAEHAIKSFVWLRKNISGITTEKGIKDYLVLLSICQTCKYMGVDFLNFLRSGEKDICVFAERKVRRRHSRTKSVDRQCELGSAADGRSTMDSSDSASSHPLQISSDLDISYKKPTE